MLSTSSTIRLDVVENAIVAGAREGEGAEDVVWVRDCAERDLSRNSTIDCQSVMSARAQAAQTRLLDAFGRAVPDAAVAHPSWRRGFANGNAGLDFVPLDPAVWADARRIEINVDPSRGWPSSAEIAARFGVAPNRVPEGFVKERWEDDQWKTVASPERLRQILAKFLGAPDDTWDSDDWREVLDAAEEVGGKLDLHFQVAMVLARKK